MNIKKDFLKPVLILSIICFIVAAALAIVNYYTKDVIKDAAYQRAREAMKVIIPEADGFESFDIELLRSETGMPRTVSSVYRTTNNTGFIFMVMAQGYGVQGIKLICGINPDGKIIKSEVLQHDETQGLGTPVFEQAHAGQYWGKSKYDIEDINVISGATITSNAYKTGIKDAFAAFEIIMAHYIDGVWQ